MPLKDWPQWGAYSASKPSSCVNHNSGCLDTPSGQAWYDYSNSNNQYILDPDLFSLFLYNLMESIHLLIVFFIRHILYLYILYFFPNICKFEVIKHF